MSFSQFIKDYIDAINDFCDSFYGNINLVSIIQFTLFYLGQSLKFLIQYVLTFRWFNDFCSLKITIPQLVNSNFIEAHSLENPILHFFSFFDTPDLTQYPFFSGLVNSFLLSLPVSSSQILWLRRLTIEGIPAGVAAGMGVIAGQSFLFLCLLFGFRFLIFPWLSFEFLHYILGIVLTLSIVYKLAHKPLRRIKVYETNQLVKIFLFHFCLTWTEQSTLFQYLSNISFTPEPTLFEILNSVNSMQFFISNWTYMSGLITGTILSTLFFGWAVLWIGYALSTWFNFAYSRWVRGFHFSSLTLMIAFTLTSLPYYNLDYLITSPFGFISHDDALKGFQLRTNSRDLKKGKLGEYSSHTSLDTDPAPYDRGRYLTSSEVELTFEDLNYQGEYVWRSRNDRLASGSPGIVNKLMKKFLPNFKKSKINLKSNLKKNAELSSDISENSIFPGQNFDFYSSIYPFFPEREDLIQRFVDDYQTDVPQSSFPDLSHEVDEEPYSAFCELAKYGFDSFAALEDVESDEFEETLGKKIKSKYYSNLVYKSILNFELSQFINRQPKQHSLKKEEENTLFKKRLILANYYDSLRDYAKIPYSEAYQDLFLGPKSYANRVYNQQFKGTLKLLRRLFSISLENKENLKKESLLKFDQPLYKEEKSEQNPILHEELKNKFPYLKYGNQTPFLKETNPAPFYAGWDEQLRKFLVTNYLLDRSETNQIVPYFNKAASQVGKFKTIHFLTWPLSKMDLDELKESPKQPLSLLFSSFDDPANEQQRDIFEYSEVEDYDVRVIYETLPSILKRVDLRDKDKAQVFVQPLRGGFLWPGSEPLNIEVKQNILKFIPQLKRGWRDSNP